MRRFVREYANHEMAHAGKERKEYIKRVLEYCERHLMTDSEAVWLIAKAYYDNLGE